MFNYKRMKIAEVRTTIDFDYINVYNRIGYYPF